MTKQHKDNQELKNDIYDILHSSAYSGITYREIMDLMNEAIDKRWEELQQENTKLVKEVEKWKREREISRQSAVNYQKMYEELKQQTQWISVQEWVQKDNPPKYDEVSIYGLFDGVDLVKQGQLCPITDKWWTMDGEHPDEVWFVRSIPNPPDPPEQKEKGE